MIDSIIKEQKELFNDVIMENIVDENYSSFKSYEKDMLDFTSDNIFN